MLVEAGFRPKEFLNWPETERQIAVAMLSAVNNKRWGL